MFSGGVPAMLFGICLHLSSGMRSSPYRHSASQLERNNRSPRANLDLFRLVAAQHQQFSFIFKSPCTKLNLFDQIRAIRDSEAVSEPDFILFLGDVVWPRVSKVPFGCFSPLRFRCFLNNEGFLAGNTELCGHVPIGGVQDHSLDILGHGI